MRGRITGKSGTVKFIGMAMGAALMSGCIAGQETDDALGGDAPPSLAVPAAARMGTSCPPGDGGTPPVEQALLTEEWNAFDTGIWTGDGDESVERGLFTARVGAASTAANWRPAGGIALAGGRTVRFSSELTIDPDQPGDLRGRAAQFFVSCDPDDSFQNYLIVDARYFPREGRVTIETYGLTGDVSFDRVFDLAWSRAAEGRLRIEIAVSAGRFDVSLDGQPVDRIALASMPSPGVYVLEAGVQRSAEGAWGLIDRTSVTLQTPAAGGNGGGKFVRCKHRNATMAEKRERKRCARERLAHCAKPSYALKAAAEP